MKMVTIAAMCAAFIASTGLAMANPVGTAPRATSSGQVQSNESIRAARRYIAHAVTRLSNDAWDYGGHKEAAMDDLQSADSLLAQALQWACAHNNARCTSGSTGAMSANAMGPGGQGAQEGQGGSNGNITYIRGRIAAAISALNADASDYGGYKHRAIGKLSAADSEMAQAIKFVHQPGVVNGSQNQGLSNANLAYAKEHVDTAIDRLNGDAHDYGGHRVAAISDLNTANTDIADALSYDRTHGNYNGTSANPMGGMMGTSALGQQASNNNLQLVSQHIEAAIDGLQRDAHDYDGYRAKAVQALIAARSQIQQALAYQSAHPG
jgi:hypothetical protein